MPPPSQPARTPKAARALLVLIAAALVLAAVLVVAFDPEVQTVDASELAARRDDARAFFAGDFGFVVVYAVLIPLALLRFGRLAGHGSAPRWMTIAAGLLAVAGLVDAVENVLLLTATGSPSPDTVDVAHALAVPKVALFVLGALPALAAAVLAGRAVAR